MGPLFLLLLDSATVVTVGGTFVVVDVACRLVGGKPVANTTAQVQQSDFGLKLRVTVYQTGNTSPFILTGVTAVDFIFVSPLGVKSQGLGMVDDLNLGQLAYVTKSNELSSLGTWQLQAVLTFSDGTTVFTTPMKLKVGANL